MAHSKANIGRSPVPILKKTLRLQSAERMPLHATHEARLFVVGRTRIEGRSLGETCSKNCMPPIHPLVACYYTFHLLLGYAFMLRPGRGKKYTVSNLLPSKLKSASLNSSFSMNGLSGPPLSLMPDASWRSAQSSSVSSFKSSTTCSKFSRAKVLTSVFWKPVSIPNICLMIFAIVPWVVWPLSTTLKMILSFGALVLWSHLPRVLCSSADLHPTTTSGSLSALDFGIHAREQAESLSTLPRTVRRYLFARRELPLGLLRTSSSYAGL
ncbi:hypothetical protein KC320_g23 [Hortaea werneckii]|nr:hypothetical protein KC320_g23 [Hortaea werneckii]